MVTIKKDDGMKAYSGEEIRLKDSSSNSAVSKFVDFRNLLREFDLAYTIDEFYLQVGEISQVQGWILHLSVVKDEVETLLRRLIPELVSQDIPFKIIRDTETAKLLLDAALGYYRLGKMVAIYPKSQTGIAALAARLIQLTAGFRGPAIPTDKHLGSIVYTRYGSYHPILKSGDRVRYIYNEAMELVPDEFIIPYVPPENIQWPFSGIVPAISRSSGKLLHNIYKPLFVIKDDSKGRVLKGIYMKSLFDFRHCIIKEGKRDMWLDDSGRDIRDRLAWQYELCKDLSRDIPVPRIFDLFEENGDLYLVMEFIKGRSLEAIIADLYKTHLWSTLPAADQALIFKYMIRIVRVIGLFHEKGYIHRDITPANFLADKRDRIFLIDMELSYSVHRRFPAPPFKYGTPGYVSREQKYFREPDTMQDVYAVGALLLYAFTGLSPLKYNVKEEAILLNSLDFFIRDTALSALIAGCMHREPSQRYLLTTVVEQLEMLQQQYTTGPAHTRAPLPTYPGSLADARIQEIIDDGWKRMLASDLLTEELLWDSPVLYNADGRNGFMERRYLPDFYNGMSGILYCIAKAKLYGYDITALMPAYERCLAFVKARVLADTTPLPPGLYHGLAGVAVCVAGALEAKCVSPDDEHAWLLQQCFAVVSDSFDYANGIAGQGMALLYCSGGLRTDFAEQQLSEYVGILVQHQHKDGSWNPDNRPGSQGNRNISYAGGSTGIIGFLLAYARRYPGEVVIASIRRGLNWLLRLGVRRKDTFFWRTADATGLFLTSRDHGMPGIASLFINAYQQLGDPLYKTVAEQILHYLCPFPVEGDLTLASGLSGLGEVYLEAFSVFKNDEWKNRADWIAHVLAHLLITDRQGISRWAMDHSGESVADLMTGSCGAIHFFMNYHHPAYRRPLLHAQGYPGE